MNTTLLRRAGALLTSTVLAGSLALVVGVASVAAATDPGCTALGGADGTGTCRVSGASTPIADVTLNEPLHLLSGARVHLANALPSRSLTVNAPNLALEMDKNSSIDGAGKSITINVPTGNMVMHGTAAPANTPNDDCYNNGLAPNTGSFSLALGAQITSTPALVTTTVTINVGDINHLPTPTGSFKMERCSVVSVNSPQSAGTVVINAGHDVDIDGIVMSEGGLSGVGANQPPGGGPITVRTSCELKISNTGVVSSKGRDAGADLVHLEGCDVTIDGLVQSTAPGHGIPSNPANHCDVHPHAVNNTDTGCIEVWAEELVISNTGEVNADVSSSILGGPDGTSYIDLFAEKEITVSGRTGATDTFSVHADSKIGSDTTPNKVTVFSHTSTIIATGRAFSASNTGNGSYGGTVDIEASGKVTLTGATVNAFGSDGGGNTPSPPCSGVAGACGAGGHIIVRSWNSDIAWTSGVGNVVPDVAGSPKSGTIALTACGTITDGANFGTHTINPAPGSLTETIVPCAPGPALPAYVEAAFAGTPGVTGDREIWTRCAPPGPGSKSGLKFLDQGGLNNGPSYTYTGLPTDPGINNWTIQLLTDAGVFITDTTTAPAPDGSYAFNALDPGTYRVCEVLPAGWTQSFPNTDAGKGPVTVPPAGETIITCPNGTKGYRFTIFGGETLTGNNFGNFQPTVVCPEDPTRIPTFTVNRNNPISATNFWTVTDAYNAAKVVLGAQIVGIYTESTENIVIDTYAGSSMRITECQAAKETGGADKTKAVWDITSTKPVTIVGPSVVGGGSAVGWLVESNGHTLKSVRSDGVVIGIKVTGDNNEITGINDVGTKTANTGDGIDVIGNGNKITGNTIGNNGGIGVLLFGNNNFLQATESNNGSDGVRVIGTGNTLKQNISSGNGGFQFNLVAAAINGGSNKANGQAVPGATCPTFPAAGTQC